MKSQLLNAVGTWYCLTQGMIETETFSFFRNVENKYAELWLGQWHSEDHHLLLTIYQSYCKGMLMASPISSIHPPVWPYNVNLTTFPIPSNAPKYTSF